MEKLGCESVDRLVIKQFPHSLRQGVLPGCDKHLSFDSVGWRDCRESHHTKLWNVLMNVRTTLRNDAVRDRNVFWRWLTMLCEDQSLLWRKDVSVAETMRVNDERVVLRRESW